MKVKLGLVLAGVLSIGLLQSCGAAKDAVEEETDAILDEDEDEKEPEGDPVFQGAVIQQLYAPTYAEDDVDEENPTGRSAAPIGALCFEVYAPNAAIGNQMYGGAKQGLVDNIVVKDEDFTTWEDSAGKACDEVDPNFIPVAKCSDSSFAKQLEDFKINGKVDLSFNQYLPALVATNKSEGFTCDWPNITADTPTTWALYLSDKQDLQDPNAQITCQEISNEKAVVALAAVEAVTGGAIGEGFTPAGVAPLSCENATVSENNPWVYEKKASCVDNGLATTLAGAGLVGSSVTFVAESAALARYMEIGADLATAFEDETLPDFSEDDYTCTYENEEANLPLGLVMGIDADTTDDVEAATYSVCVDVTGAIGWQAEAYLGNAYTLYSKRVFPGFTVPAAVVSSDFVLGGCAASESFSAAETCVEQGTSVAIGLALGDADLAADLSDPTFHLDATSSGDSLGAVLTGVDMVDNCVGS